MLIGAAAQRWTLPPDQLVAADGRVSHAPSGQSASYGELVDDAMRQPIPVEVPLKTRDRFRLVGKTQRRIDTPDKVVGRTQYGIDVRLPGMRVATVRACPVFGGTLAAVDDSRARQVRGVVDVLTIDNAVAVIGEHFWAARKGLEALDITWNYGDNAAVQHADIVGALDAAFGTVEAVPAAAEGDANAAFASEGARTLEAVYTLPFLAHASLEPINTTVHVRPDACEIWVGTQVPGSAQAIAAGVLGREPSTVILHNYQIGGGFGRRLSVESIEQAVALASKADYPIKFIWTREEDIQHDVYRPMYRDRISGALDADGRLAALVDHVTGGSVLNSFIPGGFPMGTLDSDAVSGIAETPYTIPNRLVDWTRVDPPVPLSWWRGVGETHNCFVLESFLDEMALAAGMDPIEFRLQMLGDNPRGAAVLERVRTESGWGEDLPPRTGRGVSFHQAFTSPLALVTQAHVTEEGQVRLERITAVIDPGVVINPDTIVAQIQGGVIFGLSAALYNGITIADGRVVQSNFNDYRQIRIDEIPPRAATRRAGWASRAPFRRRQAWAMRSSRRPASGCVTCPLPAWSWQPTAPRVCAPKGRMHDAALAGWYCCHHHHCGRGCPGILLLARRTRPDRRRCRRRSRPATACRSWPASGHRRRLRGLPLHRRGRTLCGGPRLPDALWDHLFLQHHLRPPSGYRGVEQ
jgi:isoquinoline 1-oxidoreductase beta subunit